jgi:uncharacterized protein YndB with AHSA1/START domain
MAETNAPVLNIRRTFDATRADVFDAWTIPRSAADWWGPKDFSLLFDEKDLRAGGKWRMGMTRKGEDHISGGVYRQISRPDRLAMTHAWENGGQLSAETLVTITLSERGKNTEMVFEQTGFADAATRDGHRLGWTEAFDALSDALSRQKDVAA